MEYLTERTDPRRESNDPKLVADYLRELKDPIKRVEEGLYWMQKRGTSVATAIDVATIVLNNVPTVLNELKSLRAEQTKP